jgi:hypothetical protein
LKQCPLCSDESHQTAYHQDKNRCYIQCGICDLVWVPEEFWLSKSDEKAIYDLHENSSDDLGYQRFLSRTVTPLLAKISIMDEGLDFGCGPSATISHMLAQHNIMQRNYDLYYFNDRKLLEQHYNFITMTEVIEHISNQKELIELLDSLLEPKATLAVMTKRVSSQEAFTKWHYKNDATHVCFYSLKTFQWLAVKMNWELQVIDDDVIFLCKSAQQ